jgi:hypothetical protein
MPRIAINREHPQVPGVSITVDDNTPSYHAPCMHSFFHGCSNSSLTAAGEWYKRTPFENVNSVLRRDQEIITRRPHVVH